MHVLVTGGAGFIGSHIVEYHLKNGDIVHVLDNLSTGRKENIAPFKANPNFHFTKTDILIYKDLEKVVCWADRIYHFAAVVGVFRVIKEPEKVLAINIGATERLLRAAKSSEWSPRILIASTSEVYGHCGEKQLREDSPLTIGSAKESRTTYSISKIAAESFGLTYYRRFNLPITIFRLFNTIGPRQVGEYGMVVPRLIQKAIKNDAMPVYGTGNQTRSFCDVRDMVALMDQVANNKDTFGEIYNIGHNQEISINQLATLIKELAKSKSEIEHIPYNIAYGENFDDFMFRKPNLQKILTLTSYHYQWSLEKTLSDLIEHARKA